MATHFCGTSENKDDEKLNNITQRFGVVDEQLDTECSDEDLQHFGQYLVEYSKYANALGLSQADIEEIEGDIRNTKLKFTAVLKKWKSKSKLEPSLATYRSLLKVAIKLEDGNAAEEICKQIKCSVSYDKSASQASNTKNEDQLEQLRKSNSIQQQQSSESAASLSDDRSQSNQLFTRSLAALLLLTSSQSLQGNNSVTSTQGQPCVRFECGCKKCSAYDYISGKNCPKPKPFPKLEISQFSQEEIDHIETEFNSQTMSIYREFSGLIMNTFIELREKISHSDLIAHLKVLLQPNRDFQQSSQILNELDGLNPSDLPYHVVNKYYCSWFDYSLIEYLRKAYLYPNEDKALDSYKEHLRCYVSRRCFFHLHNIGPWPEGHIIVIFKTDKHYSNLSKESIKNLQHTFCNTIEVNPYHLSFMRAQEGCTELFFVAPPYFNEISLSKYQITELKKYGFLNITIGEKMLLQREDPAPLFYDIPQIMEFSSSGGLFQSNDGVEIKVPPHTVPQWSKLVVKVQSNFPQSDVFVMPEGIQSASPSYLISCDHTTELNNEITVTIEHHVRVSTEKETDSLVFLQADPIPDEKGVYKYREVDLSKGKSTFVPGENKGTYSTRIWSRWLYKIGLRIINWFTGDTTPESPLPDPNRYTVRVYWSNRQTTECIVFISLFHNLYFKMLEDRLKSLTNNTNWHDRNFEEPLYLCLDRDEIEFDVVCNPFWKCVLSQQKMNKVAFDYPATGNNLDLNLPDTYPPHIQCQFSPDQGVESTTCTLEVHGFDRSVKFNRLLTATFSNRSYEHPTDNVSKFESLVLKTGVNDRLLDSEIKETDCQMLGRFFDSVPGFLQKLNLDLSDCYDVTRITDREGIQAGVAHALTLWRRMNPYRATFRNVVGIVMDLRRMDIATEICKYIVELASC